MLKPFAWSLDVDIGNIVEKSAIEGMRKIVYCHTSFLCGIHQWVSDVLYADLGGLIIPGVWCPLQNILD